VFPTVPIPDELVAVVSIAPPIALAVYTGWLRSSAARGVAAVTVITAAALGAWLGYRETAHRHEQQADGVVVGRGVL
jgi:hypothetical protein